ncbi:hypothetical protein AB1Y20_014185 [Prymnesium parvum]|uniref:JmjC domain-containing protein n=1 Tax=Prymnesium parvum TaxID=97485 RepID=A0AB34IGF1_PRYPA
MGGRQDWAPRRAAPAARPYPSWLVGGAIERRRWDDPHVAELLARGIPCVLHGAPLAAPLIGRWSFDFLSRHLGAAPTLATHFAPRATRSFARFYGGGLGRGGVRAMSFAQFAAAAEENEKSASPRWRYYLQAALLEGLTRRKSLRVGGALHTPVGTLDVGAFGEEVVADLRRLGWEWLGQACATAHCHGFHSCTMWAGYGGGATPLHFDAMSNFFAQVEGRKTFLVFLPEESFHLYPFPCAHVMDSYAMPDLERADTQRYPSLARARGLEATLAPGDVLWLPSFCWHYVRQLDEGRPNLSLNFWVGVQGDGENLLGAGRHGAVEAAHRRALGGAPQSVEARVEAVERCARAAAAAARRAAGAAARRQDDADDAMVRGEEGGGVQFLMAARWVESETAQRVGAGAAGRFLTALAAGEDAAAYDGAHREASDAIGPLGSATHNAAVSIRLELLLQFGEERANALLRLLTRDGRLYPGLAPKVEGPIVNSEASEMTPPEELARMMSSDDPEASPSPFLTGHEFL